MKVTERSTLVQIAASSQQITGHAGLVLVRDLAARLGLAELLDSVTVKEAQARLLAGAGDPGVL